MTTNQSRNVSKIAAVLAIVLGAPLARAQSVDAAQPAPEAMHDSGSTSRPRGDRVHDGLFARAALGAAFFRSEVELPEQSMTGGMTGTGATGSVLLGGTPIRGLVLGGGLLMSSFSNPTFELNGQQTERAYDVVLRFASFGPFVQFYPEPTRGFYVQGFAGFMSAEAEIEEADIVSEPSTGTAVAVATGYDFWVANEWSIGPEFRLLFANIGYSGEGPDEEASVVMPTLTFSGTFH